MSLGETSAAADTLGFGSPATPDSDSEPSSSFLRNRPQKVADKPVTEEELMNFLFPPDQNNPSSASRLFLFSRYGPLVHGEIVGGSYKRHRALTKQELNDLIEQDEREELLALFLDPSVQKALTPAEQAAVITETRSIPHVADALFNYTTHEVRAFLKYLRNAHDLPDGGAIPFGVLAAAIEKEHEYRIGQLQEAHGSLVAKKTRGTPLQRGLLFKRIGMAPQHGGATAARLLKLSNVPLTTEEADLKALIERFGRCEGLVLPKDGAGKPGTVYKAMMASEADAAAVIKNLDNLKFYGQRLSVQHELLAGQELDNFMIAEKMLHKEAFSVSTMETCNDSGIRKNLALLRPVRANRPLDVPAHDYPTPQDQRQWDGLCCVRGQGKGTYVEGAADYRQPPRPAHSQVRSPFSQAILLQPPVPTVFLLRCGAQITKLNTSPNVPTVLATTHRRMGHHWQTEAEQGIHPRRSPGASPTKSPTRKTLSMEM